MSMGQGFSQELNQEQRQVLSQRMIQSMELLQLPILQLEERIDQELEKNPVLEWDQETDDASGAADEIDSSATELNDRELVESMSEERAAESEPSDFNDVEEFFSRHFDATDERPTRSRESGELDAERYADMLGNIPSRSETLQDHLIDQLSWFDISDPVRNDAEEIIYNLDRNGYLLDSLEGIFGEKLSKEERQEIDKALAIVQSLEPRGVGARDLKESLLLQIRPGDLYEKEIRTLISSHLEDLQWNRFPQIAKKTGYTFEQIRNVLQEIKKLNPRPGALFDVSVTAPILPDVYVEKKDDGVWVVRVADGKNSRIHLSPHYLQMLKDKDTESQTKEYLRKNFGSARWLLDMIEQRKTTLQRIAQEVVDHQKDFLENGPEKIRPLTLQQIADRAHVHASTVSRACCNKWMQTPKGIYPLKEFFCGSIASTDDPDEAVAQDVAWCKLKELIAKENKKNPLSDEELVKKMEDAGIRLSRRTIAKYRNLLDIPCSRQRREWTS